MLQNPKNLFLRQYLHNLYFMKTRYILFTKPFQASPCWHQVPCFHKVKKTHLFQRWMDFSSGLKKDFVRFRKKWEQDNLILRFSDLYYGFWPPTWNLNFFMDAPLMRRRGQEIGRGVRDSKSYFQICDPTVSCVIMAFWDHIEIHRTTQCSQLSIINSKKI